MTDLTERLRKLLEDATPGDLSTAERHTENETFECPLCHEGEVEASDYCNIDGKALGVQFYGIGKGFGAHERLWSETLAALPDLLTTLETLTQENARLREAGTWQPIETAPKMRTILLWADTSTPDFANSKTGSGYFNDAMNCWIWEGQQVKEWGHQPTHWMPLPPAPARKALGGGDES